MLIDVFANSEVIVLVKVNSKNVLNSLIATDSPWY